MYVFQSILSFLLKYMYELLLSSRYIDLDIYSQNLTLSKLPTLGGKQQRGKICCVMIKR